MSRIKEISRKLYQQFNFTKQFKREEISLAEFYNYENPEGNIIKTNIPSLEQEKKFQKFEEISNNQEKIKFIENLILNKTILMFQEAANNPIEDRWLAAHMPSIGLHTLLLAVFDGHGGQECAHFAQHNLYKHVRYQFDTYTFSPNIFKESLIYAIKQIELDQIEKVRDSQNLGFEGVAKVGTCVATCILSRHHEEVKLTVANMGDCEMAMFSVKDKQLVGYGLAEVHNTSNPHEQELLALLHPEEVDILQERNCTLQVKGMLMPTRALGDLRLKYAEFSTASEKKKYNLRNFPYILNKPDVQSQVLSEKDKQVVIASDGFWDYMSLEDVSEVLQKQGSARIEKELKETLFNNICTSNNVSKDGLDQIPLGKDLKRKYHDDITVVVLDLEKYQRL